MAIATGPDFSEEDLWVRKYYETACVFCIGDEQKQNELIEKMEKRLGADRW